MNLRPLLPGVILGTALIVAGLGVSLAGAALWKGALPGEESTGYARAYSTVPPAVQRAAAAPATPAPTAQPRLASPSPSVAGQARATPAPTAAPLSLQLVVCDASIDCGEDPRQSEWREVNACLRSAADATDRSIVLVVTPRNEPPNGPTDAAVLARSGLVRPTTALQCYAVRTTGGALPRGTYWIWVLEGATALTRARFVLGR